MSKEKFDNAVLAAERRQRIRDVIGGIVDLKQHEIYTARIEELKAMLRELVEVVERPVNGAHRLTAIERMVPDINDLIDKGGAH